MHNTIDMLKHNDDGLLKLDQIEDFRAYLIGHKCKTRKGNGKSQLLFVGTSAGWAVIQKGVGGVVKSPIALRSVIDDYLKTPVARSTSLAKRISAASKIPLEAPDLAKRVAAAVTEPVTTEHQVAEPGCHTHTPFLDNHAGAHSHALATEPGSHTHTPGLTSMPGPYERFRDIGRDDGGQSRRIVGDVQTCEVVPHEHSAVHAHFVAPQSSAAELPSNFHILPEGCSPVSLASQRLAMHADNTRRQQWAAFGDLVKRLEAVEKDAGPHIILSPRLREMALQGGLMITEANPFASAPVADPQHLEDLRDDFAIHCPLTQAAEESLTAFAIRRWQYADLMMKSRQPLYAD